MDKEIQRFFDGIEEIEDKNCGGCLFFCYAFYRFLIENNMETDTFQIKQYNYEKWNIEHNLEWIEGNNDDDPVSSNHFTFLYKENEYDGEGLVKKNTFSHYRNSEILYGLNGVINIVEHFCKECLIKSGWNDIFDREYAIEKIKENLDLDLSDVR